jgi:hypothetical protein
METIRRLARPLPPGYKFNRDEIYDRGMMQRRDHGHDRDGQ